MNKEDTKETTDKEKDLCKTCEHYWQDFPLPLDHYVSHCEVLDKKPGIKEMNDVVEYPCLKCPFDSYIKKIDCDETV